MSVELKARLTGWLAKPWVRALFALTVLSAGAAAVFGSSNASHLEATSQSVVSTATNVAGANVSALQPRAIAPLSLVDADGDPIPPKTLAEAQNRPNDNRDVRSFLTRSPFTIVNDKGKRITI